MWGIGLRSGLNSAFSLEGYVSGARTRPEVDPILCQSEEKMVGTTGFEPATSRTPSVRATRLRYVPTGREPALPNFDQSFYLRGSRSLSLGFEQRQESTQLIPQVH